MTPHFSASSAAEFDPDAPDGVSFPIEMAWTTPQYSRSEVDAAGKVLIGALDVDDLEGYEQALLVINNWRTSHAFPLNTFQVTLRNKAREIDAQSIVAQRVKRLSSIDLKLRRLGWLRLSEMQDIGGCRAIVGSVSSVRRLVRSYELSRVKHTLVRTDDYITAPKKSGYRGVHLIYSYFSDRSETYGGLQIEMQLRSRLQHSWATAVETVGTFTEQALKSSQGEKDWLRFFALIGSSIANRERSPTVPGTPEKRSELRTEIRHYAKKLDVRKKLTAYGSALRILENPRELKQSHYYLLVLDPSGVGTITVTGYQFSELERASRDYLESEKLTRGKPGADAVLVSVESMAALRRAYPNYFLDTRKFLDELKRATA